MINIFSILPCLWICYKLFRELRACNFLEIAIGNESLATNFIALTFPLPCLSNIKRTLLKRLSTVVILVRVKVINNNKLLTLLYYKQSCNLTFLFSVHGTIFKQYKLMPFINRIINEIPVGQLMPIMLVLNGHCGGFCAWN